jgi:hypothetical protein
MSFSVKKYPTAYSTSDNWLNPTNALGPEDNNCARLIARFGGSYYLVLSGYGFSLPTNAILDNVFICHKGAIETAVDTGQMLRFALYTLHGASSDADSPKLIPAITCSDTVYVGEVDVLAVTAITVALLNADNFLARIEAFTSGFESHFWIDAAYIRVVYHLPAVKKGLMDGFIFVS